jgi:biopolymer transport protein ExbD
MPKVKVPRKSTAIDMTAMCDVAFLLLTFFILTATARQPEPLPVDTPTSTVQIKQPTTDIATLTVGQGKVFFGVAGTNVRQRTLELMSERYGVAFNQNEKNRFSLMESFGVPIGNLKQIIAMSGTDRNKEGLQGGIPADSVGTNASELHWWIYNARIATKELNGTSLRFSIKGDSKEEYPTIKKIINMLQTQEVNKFSLITSLEGQN